MRKRIYLLPIFLLLLLAACTNDMQQEIEQQEVEELMPLEIAPKLVATRATKNYSVSDYLEMEGYERATVSTEVQNYRGQSDYIFLSGKLTSFDGSDFLWFPKGSGVIDKVTVQWPTLDKREDVPVDQSSREAFLSADWLIGVVDSAETVDLLAVEMEHERSKITFEAIGEYQYSVK